MLSFPDMVGYLDSSTTNKQTKKNTEIQLFMFFEEPLEYFGSHSPKRIPLVTSTIFYSIFLCLSHSLPLSLSLSVFLSVFHPFDRILHV